MSSKLSEISASAIISPTQAQISSELGGEAVILNMTSGIYYGLNEVGARVWELVQQPKSFGELHSTLLAEYDVAPEVCEQALMKILLDMKKSCLIKVSHEASR